MKQERLGVVILAAGKGTRMRSATPKVLHPLCGRPLILWPVEAALAAGADGRPQERVLLSKALAVGEELVAALRRAEEAHGEYERELGHRHDDWAPWYADFMVREQAGELLPA
jgi:bifunctional N-acetylglucosamine-1-phosphate-uridyltransferase/glucosamine-1-phosphate-acetyltransferase GlmU-like protein